MEGDKNIDYINQNINNCNCECAKSTIFFRDGLRSVDFILVWDAFTDQAISDQAIKKRKIFERNLMREGLELEHEAAENNGLNFIKVFDLSVFDSERKFNVFFSFRFMHRKMF